MDTDEAVLSCFAFFDLRTRPSRRKTILRTRSFFVLRSLSFLSTVRYSHDLIPKKRAPHANSATATFRGAVERVSKRRKTIKGNAGCRFVGGSSLENFLKSCSMVRLVCPDVSDVGSGKPFVRKVCDTNPMVDLIVPPLS